MVNQLAESRPGAGVGAGTERWPGALGTASALADIMPPGSSPYTLLLAGLMWEMPMTLSNLLTGLIGAVLGGLLAIGASIMTMRQQRSLTMATFAEERRQVQLRMSYTASAEILANMLTIKEGLGALSSDEKRNNPKFDRAFAAADRIITVYNPQIADTALRARINDFVILIEQWASSENRIWQFEVYAERYNLLTAFMAYLNESVKAHIDDKPLPPHESPPDLLAVKGSDATNTNPRQQDG